MESCLEKRVFREFVFIGARSERHTGARWWEPSDTRPGILSYPDVRGWVASH